MCDGYKGVQQSVTWTSYLNADLNAFGIEKNILKKR